MNDRDICNHTQMSQYFRQIDLFEKDYTEDEALMFYYDKPFDDITVLSEKLLVLDDMEAENAS